MRPPRSSLVIATILIQLAVALEHGHDYGQVQLAERQLTANASIPIVLNTGNLTCGPIFNFPPATLGQQLFPLQDVVVLGRPPTCASTVNATRSVATAPDGAVSATVGSAPIGSNATVDSQIDVAIDRRCETLGEARWWRIDPGLRCGLQFLVQCYDVLPLSDPSHAIEGGSDVGANSTIPESTATKHGNASCSTFGRSGISEQKRLYCCPDTVGVLTRDGTAVDHYSCLDQTNVQYYSYFCYRDL